MPLTPLSNQTGENKTATDQNLGLPGDKWMTYQWANLPALGKIINLPGALRHFPPLPELINDSTYYKGQAFFHFILVFMQMIHIVSTIVQSKKINGWL